MGRISSTVALEGHELFIDLVQICRVDEGQGQGRRPGDGDGKKTITQCTIVFCPILILDVRC